MASKGDWLKAKISEIPLPKLLLVLAAVLVSILFLPSIPIERTFSSFSTSFGFDFVFTRKRVFYF